MAGYIAVRLRGRDVGVGEVLRPLFDVAGSRPVALGGVGSTGWLLAGYCLEDFVTRFSRGVVPAADAIELAGGASEYLERLRERLASGAFEPRTLSPFERLDDRLGLTSVAGVALAEADLGTLEEWVRRQREPLVHLYSVLGLALSAGDAPDAFRFAYPPELGQAVFGAPLAFVRVQARQDGELEAALHSEAAVWLREGNALGGLVGAAAADANLDRFVDVAKALRRGLGASGTTELRLDGSAFLREADRIAQRFDGVTDTVHRGW